MYKALGFGLLLGAVASWSTTASHAGGKQDYEYAVRFEPKQPTLGKTYRMHIQVWNNDPRYREIFRAAILKLPEKDRLVGAKTLEQRVDPKGTHTFTFEILCGTERGNITYDLSAAWEE